MSELFAEKQIVINVGAQKSGTSWLYKCLEEHPSICCATGKETNFFSRQDVGLSEYSKRFTHCHESPIHFEASTLYLYDEAAATKIKETFPDAKIIILLRDPVERTLSHLRHLQNKGRLPEDVSIAKAIEEYPELIEHSQYSRWIPFYKDLFAKDNLLILDYQQIKLDPQQLITEVCSFCKTHSITPAFLNKRYNTSAARSNPLYNKATKFYLSLRRSRLGMILINLLKKIGLSSRTVELLLAKTSVRKNYTPSDLSALQENLAEERQYYSALTDGDHQKSS